MCNRHTAVNALASILLTHKERAHTCNKALHTQESRNGVELGHTPDPADTFDNSATFRPTLICISNKRERERALKPEKLENWGKTAKQTNATSTRVVQAQFGHNSYQ